MYRVEGFPAKEWDQLYMFRKVSRGCILCICADSQAAVLEGMFANGSAFGGTPAQEIYRTCLS